MARSESTKTKVDKKCGKCAQSVHPGNNPGWYTREGLTGMVGANFAALSTINPISVGNQKLRTNVGIMFNTLVGCPSDTNGSFMKMMTQMYAEIREKNSGAANYDPRKLGCYVHDIMTLRALYMHACRNVAAVRSTQPGNGDSPYYLPGVVSTFKYKDIAGNMANITNALKLIGKDMSVLPIPQISIFEREEFLYGRVFADSRTAKAAMMAFVPKVYITRINVDEKGEHTYNVVQHDMPTTMDNLISVMQTMLMNISSDPIVSILRGDLIKAFGYSGVDMSAYVDKPLTIEYNRTVLSQIENMNILYQNVTVTEETKTLLKTGNLIVGVSPDQTLAIPQRCDDTEWMINFHDDMVPDNGTLLSITRNMAFKANAGKELHTSGDPVLDLYVVDEVNPSTQSVVLKTFSTWIANINSTTQSTAEEGLRRVAHTASIVDGFPWVWTGSSTERTDFSFIWDVDQWALVTASQMEQMNEQCIRSLFYYKAPRIDGMIKPGRL